MSTIDGFANNELVNDFYSTLKIVKKINFKVFLGILKSFYIGISKLDFVFAYVV